MTLFGIYLAGFLVSGFISGRAGPHESEGEAWLSLAIGLLWPIVATFALAVTLGSYFAKAAK